MDDESLSDWAERRDAKIGRLRAVPLVTGDGPKASHLNPDVPRAIQRWNGYAWEPHGTAATLAEAQRIVYPRVEEQLPVAASTPQPLRTGRGRHRKPRPGE
ncbi:DUF6087 family protein [Streptomyces rubiginosohelvolus]|uniref:DUF6087 family protein n=1 Tax=Streptomyces rubiginosohelvolus TaxID=67362 RepID=UPI00364FFA34